MRPRIEFKKKPLPLTMSLVRADGEPLLQKIAGGRRCGLFFGARRISTADWRTRDFCVTIECSQEEGEARC
jgi:hypothetical protein